jgi:hypothetical protein
MRNPGDPSRRPNILRPEDLPKRPGIAEPAFNIDREDWRERNLLRGKLAGISLAVFLAFCLGALSASLFVALAILFLLIPFTCGATEGPAGLVFVCGMPVHPAALAAGLLGGGGRRHGAAAARLAVVSGALGTAFYTAVIMYWWATGW